MRCLTVLLAVVALSAVGCADEGSDGTRDAGGSSADTSPRESSSMWGEDDGSPDETYDVNACSDTPNLEEDCRTDAWEQQAGEDWDAFTAAYESGWTSGCEIAFDTENNSLYEDDTEYTLDDCTGEYPGDPASSDSLPADYPDDADAAGDEAGQHDGCTHPFNEYASAGELYWGEDTYDESICP